MDEWQAVDQYRHIIAIVMSCPLLCGDGILVDDLQAVVVYALLVNELDIFAFPVILAEHLHIVLLNQAGLFENAGVCVCQHLVPETLPFAVRKAIVIQLFQLRPQIGNQVGFLMDGQALIAQIAKQTDKFLFQSRLALVAIGTLGLGLVFGYNGAFAALGDDVEVAHYSTSPFFQESNMSSIIGSTPIFLISSIKCCAEKRLTSRAIKRNIFAAVSFTTYENPLQRTEYAKDAKGS